MQEPDVQLPSFPMDVPTILPPGETAHLLMDLTLDEVGSSLVGQLTIAADGLVGGCAADFNGDGSVNTLDFVAFLNAWSEREADADINGDGDVNSMDVVAFLNAWVQGC
jgi:hypothetical protein